MTKLSAAMFAMVVASACGGGGKKTTDTMPPPPPPTGGTEGAAMADNATPAATEKPAPEPVKAPEPPPPPPKVLKTMTPSEFTWGPLDPSAGDKGPQIATMWGDMQSGPNGNMIKMPAGSKSPLHTHTNEYHGVAVTPSSVQQDGGKLHALAQGTSWTQPAGTAHINACPGKKECIAFTHYNTGKFDFAPAQPVKGAKPDPNAKEVALKGIKWTPFDPKNPKGASWASAWGDPTAGASGLYIKIPAGNQPFWHTHKADYHAVVLAGTLNEVESPTDVKDLPVGSYYMQPGGNKHTTNCKAGGPDCIIYVYMTDTMDTQPAEEPKAGGAPALK